MKIKTKIIGLFCLCTMTNLVLAQGVVKTKINLPITWNDSANVDYTTIDFAGNLSELAPDPTNASNLVLKITRQVESLIFAGTVLGTDMGLLAPMPLTAVNRFLSAKVYCPAAGLKVRLKVENIAGGGVNVETDQLSTVANQWENLTFDFAQNSPGTPPINYANVHNKLVIFFNFGVTGANAGQQIFYLDDVVFGTFTKTNETINVGDVSLFPNPNSGTFQVKTNGNNGKETSIVITNSVGKTVFEKVLSNENGAQLIETTNLKPGIYHYHGKTGKDILVKTFTIK